MSNSLTAWCCWLNGCLEPTDDGNCLSPSCLSHSPGDSLDLLAQVVAVVALATSAPYTPVVFLKDVRTPSLTPSVDSNGFIKKTEQTNGLIIEFAYGHWLEQTAGAACFAIILQ